ncbi:MAG: biotin/lipoyl-binding protein [candidate division NC10 bacterium]|nr:biotin/lipoyl-binding protein [candidate division NC10 bacterium]
MRPRGTINSISTRLTRRGVQAALLGILCTVVASGVACSREGKATADPKRQKAPSPVRITAAAVEARDVQRMVELVGTLRPEEEVTVANENPGIIQRVLVDLGDRVSAGQLLVQLDPRDARFTLEQVEANLAASGKALGRARATLAASHANVARARAILENPRVNRRRFEELFAEGAVAASQRDAAVTEAEVAEASLRSAETQLESDREGVVVTEASVAQAEAALATARTAWWRSWRA